MLDAFTQMVMLACHGMKGIPTESAKERSARRRASYAEAEKKRIEEYNKTHFGE